MNPAQSNNVNVAPGARWDGIDEVQEVHPTMVPEYIKKGWVILMTYSARDDLPETYNDQHGYVQTRYRVEYRPVVLMGQTNLDALREAVEVLSSEKRVLAESDRKHQELKKEHAALSSRAASLESQLAGESKRASEQSTRYYELEAQKRKLEVDIGKIRSAVGDLKLKEILEGR